MTHHDGRIPFNEDFGQSLTQSASDQPTGWQSVVSTALPPLRNSRHHTQPNRVEGALQQLAEIQERTPSQQDKSSVAPNRLTAESKSPNITSERTGKDRRSLPRRESGSVVLVHTHGEEDVLSPQQIDWKLYAASDKGQLVDISLGGVSFLFAKPIEGETRVTLRLCNHVVDRTVDATATVLKCRSAPNRQWRIVCQFDRNLSFEQVCTFGRELSHSNLV